MGVVVFHPALKDIGLNMFIYMQVDLSKKYDLEKKKIGLWTH